MLEEEKTNIDHLFAHIEAYLKTRQELGKLVAAEKTSAVASTIFSSLIIFALFFFVIVFASVALAYGLAMYFGETVYGFLAVAGLYLLAAIILSVNRKKWIETPVMNAVIKNFFKNEDHD
jgi:hypothetical protein